MSFLEAPAARGAAPVWAALDAAQRAEIVELLTGDEALVEPPMDRRGGDSEEARGLADRHQLSGRRLRPGLEARDPPVRAQAADPIGGEALAGGGLASLAVEDPRDDGVGIVAGEAAQHLDRRLVHADRRRPGTRQREIQHPRRGSGRDPPVRRINSSAWVALRRGRNPKEQSWKSASKIGSITIFAAACTTRSRTAGIASGRCLPSRFRASRQAGRASARPRAAAADTPP
jgi:hypothetical protein